MFATHSTNHKNTSKEYKITAISSVLEYNFETKINQARLKLISMMILALCKMKTVNYSALANVFDSNASAESSMGRIQRFMAGFDLPMKASKNIYF